MLIERQDRLEKANDSLRRELDSAHSAISALQRETNSEKLVEGFSTSLPPAVLFEVHAFVEVDTTVKDVAQRLVHALPDLIVSLTRCVPTASVDCPPTHNASSMTCRPSRGDIACITGLTSLSPASNGHGAASVARVLMESLELVPAKPSASSRFHCKRYVKTTRHADVWTRIITAAKEQISHYIDNEPPWCDDRLDDAWEIAWDGGHHSAATAVAGCEC